MLHKAWNSKGEMPYCFPRSSIKFQGHTGQYTDFDPNWAFPDYRPVAAFKSLNFALFEIILYIITTPESLHCILSNQKSLFILLWLPRSQQWKEIDGLVQYCSKSIAKALELLQQSCTKPSKCMKHDTYIQLVEYNSKYFYYGLL